MRTQFRSLALALAIFLSCLNSAFAAGDDPREEATAALASLQKWLGSGANATAWSEYLDLKALRAELAKGPSADPAVLRSVVAKFDSGAQGLDRPQFRKLRDELTAWSEELTLAKTPQLGELATGLEPKVQPPDPAEAAKAKANLEAAVGKLDRYLATGGANGEAWRAYLMWPELQAQLKAQTPDAEVLDAIYQRFTRDKVGLELPIFADVGTALDQYRDAASAQAAQFKADVSKQLQALAAELNDYASKYSEDLALSVGSKLGFLSRVRQAGPLVRAIRGRYARPNLFATASKRLVGAGIDQDVNEQAPVHDYILGTDISGTGHTVGKLTTELIPSDVNAVLETRLVGNTKTRTVGYNGPATIYSRGNAQIAGLKRIVIDEQGFKSYPATGDANVDTNITGISARCRLVERIAWRKAGQQIGEAEQIASDHAADRVAERVDAQANDQLYKTNADYLAKFRNPLLRRREFPALLRFSTTPDALFVTALQANRVQLGAPDEAPAVEGTHDLVLRVHESMANNMAAALLSGETIKEEEMQKTVIELRGSLPENLKSEPDRDPWSITFARVKPISVKIDDDGFEITIRGQRYTSGEREFRAMNVTANYKASIEGHGAKLVRQGDLVIVPPNFVPGRSRLSSQQITLRTLLERRFGKLFEPEIKYEGLELPGAWEKAGRLDLKFLRVDAGWLAAAWIESGEPVKPKPKDNVALANP